MISVGPGSVVRLRNLRHYGEERSWVEYKHNNKKKVFLALLLGDENFDGPGSTDQDLEQMMNRLRLVQKRRKRHMKIKLMYINGGSIIVDADDKKIMDAGIVTYEGASFVYKSSPVLQDPPVFVQAKVYSHLD